ncbi:hypothetical protein ECANGB1_835 [Enterospora canceri]|uniref:Cullin family profile domain-containing protein n=1 Tax=Enterospora canceri TaxID=1081671 RepID=A0A1Y1S7E6_9MICR|nr:hypothetical protein ECANGB1_835 [Enterospora canceri]
MQTVKKNKTTDPKEVVESYLVELFTTGSVDLNEFQAIYNTLYFYCTTDDNPDVTIKGEEIYTTICSLLDTFTKEIRCKDTKFNFTNFYKLERIAHFIYAAFRMINRFYVKYTRNDDVVQVFYVRVYENHLKYHFETYLNQIMTEIVTLRSPNSEYAYKQDLMHMAKTIFKILEKNDAMKEVKVMTESYVRSLDSDEFKMLFFAPPYASTFTHGGLIKESVFMKQSKSDQIALAEHLITIFYDELIFAHILFDSYVCKLISDKSICFESVFRHYMIAIYNSNETRPEIKKLNVIISYYESSHKKTFEKTFQSFLTDAFLNNNFTKYNFVDEENRTISRMCRRLRSDPDKMSVLDTFHTFLVIRDKLQSNKLKHHTAMLKVAVEEQFSKNSSSLCDVEMPFYILLELLDRIKNPQYVVDFVSLTLDQFDLTESFVIKFMISLIRKKDDNYEKEERFIRLINGEKKSMFIRIFESFKTNRIDKFKVIKIVDFFIKLDNKIPVKLDQDISNQINIALVKQIAHSKEKLTPIYNLSNATILINRRTIRIDIIGLNILKCIENAGEISYDALLFKTAMNSDSFDQYINMLIDNQIITNNSSMISISQNDTDASHIDLFKPVEFKEVKQTTSLLESSKHPVDQAKVMRFIKIRKSATKKQIEAALPDIDDISSILDEFTKKEFIEYDGKKYNFI